MTVNSLGSAAADGRSRTAAWYAPLVPIAISIFAVSALVSYHLRSGAITGARTVAQSLIVGIYEFFGWVPSCMFFGLVLAWSSIWWVTGSIDQPGKKLARIGYLTLALAVFGNLDASAPHSGALGAFLGGGVAAVLGSFLGHVLMAPITFFALLLATDYFWMSYFERRAYERTLAPAAAGAGTSAATGNGAGAFESGVEPAVTEEFKALARLLPQRELVDQAPAGGEGQTEAPLGESAERALDRFFAEPDRNGDDPEAASVDRTSQEPGDRALVAEDEVDADGLSARLSYFERRQLRAAREAARAAMAESAESAERGTFDELDLAAALAPAGGDVDDARDEPASTESTAPTEGGSEPVQPGWLESTPVDLDAVVSDAAVDGDAVESWPSAGGLEGETERTDDVRMLGSVVPTPVLEETALRAALGFEAAAATGQSAEIASFEVRSEPLFPAAPAGEVAVPDAPLEGGDEDPDDPASSVDGPILAPQPPLERARGFLAPVRDDDDEGEREPSGQQESDAEGTADPEPEGAEGEPVAAEADDEPLVSIPRPPEGPRQQNLFVSTVDEALVRDALDVLQENSRATASMLQRRLRIDYEQARDVLALLAHRGLVDLAEDGSQARRRS